MEKRVLLTIEYDGTGFSGWQRQPEVRTVQGTIEKVLTELIGEPVTVDGVSRTDAGVHACDQKAVFSADLRVPVDKLARVLNSRLHGRPESRAENDDIRIVSAEEIQGDFDLRGSVAGKTYRYSIRNAAEMPVFDRNFRYLVTQSLDVSKMREAAEYIKGMHDFRCFQAAGGEPGKTTVRTIKDISINEEPVQSWVSAAEARDIPVQSWVSAAEARDIPVQSRDSAAEARDTFPVQNQDQAMDARDIFIDISGDGFLYNMVRIITGTLVEVGLGKREPDDLKRIIESRDRTQAGHTAPPQGLCLMKVFFRNDRLNEYG